ncbi:hypothetical protein [Caulobacter sp. LARHSG274]
MRFVSTFAALALAMAAAAVSPAAANAQQAPAAAAPAAYTTENTEIGALLDDPAAKAVLAKHIPNVVANPGIDQARSMTLKQVQQYSPDLTDEVLAKIDADLAKLPAKK